MSHSQTPPVVPALPTEAIRKVIALNPELSTPEVDAWLAAQLAHDQWKAEENKRLRFISAVEEAIYWDDQQLDTSEIRALYERTVQEARGE